MKRKFIAYNKEGNEIKVDKPKSMFDINLELYLTKSKGCNQYDDKPIHKFSHDMFASYVLDNINFKTGEVSESCYFSECFKDCFNDLPKINYKRVFLYGVFDIIEKTLKEYNKK